MAEHLYLPALSKTETGMTIPSKGSWANQSSKIILDIANGIEITEKASKKGISSIPDIWARPLMFQSALRENSKHPLREKLTQEWRGLMSLLALAKYKKYDLSVHPVDLIPNQVFVRALKNLSPKGVQLEQGQVYNWIDPELKDPILLIKFKNVPIGAFSPTTLVYTGSDYAQLLLVKAPELKDFLIDANGYLVPPTKENDRAEIEFIGEWLGELNRRIGKVVNTNDSKAKQTVGNINGLVQDWLKDIRNLLGVPPDADIDAHGVKTSDQIEIRLSKSIKAFEEGRYNIYRFLLCSLIADETAGTLTKYSEISLDSTRNLTEYKEIVVINEKLLASGKKVWDPKSLKDLGGDSKNAINLYFKNPKGTQIDEEVTDFKGPDGKKAGMWIRPEMYFLSDYLLKAKSGDIIEEKETGLNFNQSSFVWPFRKEILNFFTPEDIVEKLQPKFNPDGSSVKFSINLPVSGNYYTIEKTYRYKGKQDGEGEIIETEVPVIELFPDYNGENWRRYYLLQSHVDSFVIAPFIASPNYVENNRQSSFTIDKVIHKVRIKQLSGDSVFPDGIEIFNTREDSLGLILINKYRNWNPENILQGSMEIGIDFGTSNTNVYFNEENTDGKRWCYNFPQYIRQLTASNESLRNETLNNSFIPIKPHELPIPTAVLNKYNTNEKPNLLLDYFIYFATSYKIPQNVYTNLKWEKENPDREDQGNARIDNTDEFIESLLFLIFLEVCRKSVKYITIGCSYPKAFSHSDRSRFGTLWREALEKLYRGEDRIINIYDSNNPDDIKKPFISGPFLMTEGIAAGYFFANPGKFSSTKEKKIENATLASGAICLDVGGATTDISIWCDRTEIALFDTSILLAGKQICEYIRSKPELWNILFAADGKGKIALNDKKNNEDQFAATLNMVLKAEEKVVYANLSRNIKNSALQSLMKTILLEFGALAYYTSLLCLKANEKSDNGSLLTKIQESGINLYWGGNGSKFISWLDFGSFTANSTCVKFLSTIFYYGLQVHNIDPHRNISQFASPEPKSEACGGLIVSDLTAREKLDAPQKKNSGSAEGGIIPLKFGKLGSESSNEGNVDHKSAIEFICGEIVELTDSSFLDSLTYINNKNLFIDQRTLVKNTTLTELEKFVEILNATASALGLLSQGNEIVLTDTIKATIKNDILNSFKSMQTKDVTKRRIQPVFIMEVTKLMQEIDK